MLAKILPTVPEEARNKDDENELRNQCDGGEGMKEEHELKPCPFCGGAAEIKSELFGLNGYRIGCASIPTQYTCPGCIDLSAYYWSEEMAISSWNRRTETKAR